MSANAPSSEVSPLAPPIGPAEYSRLRWRCRRGLLENDLFIARFFAKYGHKLSKIDADALYELMNLSDNALLDLLLARVRPETLSPQACHVLQLLQQC